jgi:hypothetical protein
MRGDRIHASGVAAGNVLAAAHDEGVAPFALGLVRTTLSMTVVDHDRWEPHGGSFDLGGGGAACGQCTVPEGFPPSVWYELEFESDPRRWSQLLVRGPVEDVWCVRWVDTRKSFFIGDLSDQGDADDVARGWLAAMLGLGAEELPLQEWYHAHHRWKDVATYLAFVQAERSAVSRDAAELLDRLVRAGFLTEEQRKTTRVEPQVEVYDERDDKGTPLPETASER